MTTEHQASRTLVKSPPELWAECSDAETLARHIAEFGEIRITRLEPETSVAWEGECASGTVQIEPSGWGTRVTLTVQTEAEEPIDGEGTPDAVERPLDQLALESESSQEESDAMVEETVAESNPSLASDPAPAAGRWKRLITRSRAWFKPREHETAPLPEAITGVPAQIAEPPVPGLPEAEEPEAVPKPAEAPAQLPDVAKPGDQADPEAVLTAALDSLGQAHHRPFSRA